MVCRSCNRVLAEGTSYCLYCGAPQVEDLPETLPVGVPRPEPAKPEFVPVEVAVMPYGETVPLMEEPPMAFPEESAVTAPVEVPLVSANPVPVSEPAAPAANTRKILDIVQKFVIPGIAVVALILAVVFGISNSKLKGELESAKKARLSSEEKYQEQIEELEATVDEQEQTVEEIKAQLKDLQIDAQTYNAMVKAMTEHEIGFGTHTFQASDKFVVAKKGFTGTKVTLTAYWNKEESATVYVEHSSSCAELFFDKDSWNKTVTMTVQPKEVGFTVATFSNSVDDTTFSILILVVE